MTNEKDFVPNFKTEGQEAEYWDTHSPLDLVAEPQVQKVRVRGAKDRPITIRLDSGSRARLEKLAYENGIGPSTFSRIILMSAIEQGYSLLRTITSDETKPISDQRSERPRVEVRLLDTTTKRIIDTARINLQKALHQALEGNWQNAISLCKEADSIVPKGDSHAIKGEMKMVWSCIQRVSIKPLLEQAEEALVNWKYEEVCRTIEKIIRICQESKFPLDYGDLSIRMLKIAQVTCAEAEAWKVDVDAKLNQVIAGMGILRTDFEDVWRQRLDERPTFKIRY